MKDKNPKPMYLGSPHFKAFWPYIVGHKAKIPDVGRVLQAVDPPPQAKNPELPISVAPINRITVPVTIGGKRRFKTLGGTKAKPISRSEANAEVPRKYPYA